ncbi:MAG: ABC transporter permease [Deltaproteobacteria bacterium]|nr:ABC transporter permease [Deltaproteobacteria bacterium]MBW2395454.1 ABC transporter permease [Deltaproteobacteria bacterium]
MSPRWLSRPRYFLRTAWSGLRESPVTGGISVVTIALCLLLVGSFALLVANMERILDRFGEEFRVSAYLEDNLTDADLARLRERVAAAPGVERVDLVTKEAALERFRASHIGRAALLDGMEDNPLPASLELVLAPEHRNADALERLAEAVDGFPGIAEFGYGADWVSGYHGAVALVRGVAMAIGAVLVLATLLIVTNTIRLAVYARRDEVSILRLVGGSRTFIAIPYLLEGAAQGLVGGLVGLALLFALFHLALPVFAGSLELLLGYVSPSFLEPRACAGLVAVGAGLGVLGSAAALGQGRLGE